MAAWLAHIQVTGVGGDEPSELVGRLKAYDAKVTWAGSGGCEITFPLDETKGARADDAAIDALTALRAAIEAFPDARSSALQVMQAGAGQVRG